MEEEIKEEVKEHNNTLKVKGDPEGIAPEERKRRVKALAGAIAHTLREHQVVYIRCFSPATAYKASKAIAIASGYMKVQGSDLYSIISFITAEMDNTTKTGLCYECFVNKK